MNIKIGSFNCLNFGIGSAGKEKSELISKIIKEEEFDVVALQEIKSDIIVQDVLRKLNCGNLKGKWQGCSDREIGDYAFIWNSKHLILPKTTLPNGTIRTFYPHIYRQYGRDPELGKISLARPPFYGRFQTAFIGLPKIEIRLINTHIRYSKGRDGEELAPLIGETILRKNEFKALTKNIYYRVSDKIYGVPDGESTPLTAYTILLGDYNLNLNESKAGSPYLGELETIEIKCLADESKTKKIVTKQTELTTLKKNVEENQEDNIFANNYDHFSYDENRFDAISKSIAKINTVKKYCKNNAQKHLETVSDHVPIKITLTIEKGS